MLDLETGRKCGLPPEDCQVGLPGSVDGAQPFSRSLRTALGVFPHAYSGPLGRGALSNLGSCRQSNLTTAFLSRLRPRIV